MPGNSGILPSPNGQLQSCWSPYRSSRRWEPRLANKHWFLCPPPLACTVAVKGMTVFKEVHAKQVHKGIVKVHKKKKSVKCAYASNINPMLCTQINVLGLHLIPIHLYDTMSHIAHIGPSWSHTQLAVSRHNKQLLFAFLPRSRSWEGYQYPSVKVFLEVLLKFFLL